MNKNTSEVLSDARHFKTALYSRAVPGMIVVCGVAMILNITVLWSSRWIAQRFSPTMVLTLSLAMADLAASLVVAVSTFCNSYLPFVHKIVFNYHICLATTMEAMRLASVVTSVFHMGAISCMHYIAAAHGLRYHSIRSRWQIFVVIFLLWIVPHVAFLAVFAIFPDYGFNSENCSKTAIFQTSKYRVPVVLIMTLPLIVMCLLYLRIIMLLKRRLLSCNPTLLCENNQSSSSNISLSSNGPPRRYRTSGRDKNRRMSLFSAKQAMGASYTALILVGSFLVAMLPVCIVYLLTCSDCKYPAGLVRDDLFKSKVLTSVSILSNSLLIIKCAVNPFLYAFRIPEIKRALRLMVGSGCRGEASTATVVQQLYPLTGTARKKPRFEVSFQEQGDQFEETDKSDSGDFSQT